MSAETITRTIQLILAPVVLVSACSIFVGGLLSHYDAINGRMRTMARERLEILRGSDADTDRLLGERLAELDVQLPQLLRRHALVHHALLAAYISILILVASMCAIGYSAVTASEWLQQAVRFEVQRVLRLVRQPGRVTPTDLAETVLSNP